MQPGGLSLRAVQQRPKAALAQVHILQELLEAIDRGEGAVQGLRPGVHARCSRPEKKPQPLNPWKGYERAWACFTAAGALHDALAGCAIDLKKA
ncbi:MAG: hypothetical protein HBSAPP03_20040 [Phycisphaerae bacterium]|nr:MAG: hypothetical protein HBSAPP03_20040 [Phycisphaerae bacterium]